MPGFDTAWVIKLGARGARFPEGEYPAPAVAVVDTTGAGDALAAGYLVGGPRCAIGPRRGAWAWSGRCRRAGQAQSMRRDFVVSLM